MCASEKYTPRVQKLRQEYWLKIKDMKARALEGERAYGHIPHQRGKNVTLIGAIALKGLVAQINLLGAFLEFLPPYSPDFSPIENCWSKLKSILRSIAPRTYQELEQAIVTGFEQISLKDIHNWFTHCCYCDQPYSEAQLAP